MKAYYIDAGIHKYAEFSEDGYTLYEDGWFGNVVYAETASKAKHLFIVENRWIVDFEYTDKMSIRVLAHEGDEKWTPHVTDAYDDEVNEWMRGRLTGFGYERYEQFLKDQEFLASE